MARSNLKIYDGYNATTAHLQSDIRYLQELLRNKGYNVTLNGRYSEQVETAVKMFQRSNGLFPSGVMDGATWAALEGGTVAPPVTQPSQPTQPTVVVPVAGTGERFQTVYAPKDVTLMKQLNEIQQYKAHIFSAAQTYRIPTAVIAGIGSRESHWGLALTPPGPGGTGDKGHGRGLLQVDDRWHVAHTSGTDWQQPELHIPYAMKVLRGCIDSVQKKTTLTGNELLRAGLAAYNKGPRTVYEAVNNGLDPDSVTTGGNYGTDVFHRSGWFQLYGW